MSIPLARLIKKRCLIRLAGSVFTLKTQEPHPLRTDFVIPDSAGRRKRGQISVPGASFTLTCRRTQDFYPSNACIKIRGWHVRLCFWAAGAWCLLMLWANATMLVPKIVKEVMYRLGTLMSPVAERQNQMCNSARNIWMSSRRFGQPGGKCLQQMGVTGERSLN